MPLPAYYLEVIMVGGVACLALTFPQEGSSLAASQAGRQVLSFPQGKEATY